jgi:hypothetical protein
MRSGGQTHLYPEAYPNPSAAAKLRRLRLPVEEDQPALLGELHQARQNSGRIAALAGVNSAIYPIRFDLADEVWRANQLTNNTARALHTIAS